MSINLAPLKLHMQFPIIAGLQDTGLGLCKKITVQKGKILQVLHDQSHWVLATNAPKLCRYNDVFIYDSLYSVLRSHIKNGYNTNIPNKKMWRFTNKASHRECATADNRADCGSFVKAFATDVAFCNIVKSKNYDVVVQSSPI